MFNQGIIRQIPNKEEKYKLEKCQGEKATGMYVRYSLLLLEPFDITLLMKQKGYFLGLMELRL